MKITPEALKTIRARMDLAFTGIAADVGLASLKCGKCTYDPRAGHFTMKVEGVAEGGADQDAARYDANAKLMDLPERGTTFNSGNATYKIVGLNTTGTKVIVSRIPDGKLYLYPTDSVRALAKKAA